MLETYHALGLRQMILACNVRNLVVEGCHEGCDGGLSAFGGALVREMNRVGILLDCNHTGYLATMEAMGTSEAAVVFSHSNVYALRGHQRNIKDEQIQTCAATGRAVGINGINGIADFPRDDDASLETLLRHVA